MPISRQMMPMKISGSQVSMKVVMSSKTDGPWTFGGGDTMGALAVAGDLDAVLGVPLADLPVVLPVGVWPVAGVVAACADAAGTTTSSASASATRLMARRRRRSGEGTVTTVIHASHRQAGGGALPHLVRRPDGRACRAFSATALAPGACLAGRSGPPSRMGGPRRARRRL